MIGIEKPEKYTYPADVSKKIDNIDMWCLHVDLIDISLACVDKSGFYKYELAIRQSL